MFWVLVRGSQKKTYSLNPLARAAALLSSFYLPKQTGSAMVSQGHVCIGTRLNGLRREGNKLPG